MVSDALVMPSEFYGKLKPQTKYVKSVPREWTEAELVWVSERVSDGFTCAEIAAAIDRTEVSVSTKMKRLSKSLDTYNEKHRDLKYAANSRFLDLINPSSVLDVFAGNSFYLNRGISSVVTNDVDERFDTDFHDDALVLLCKLFADGKKFDVIDLDPYGSAYDSLHLSLKMARKGLVVSFGEWGQKRWRRFDFVRPRYGIDVLESFVAESFIDELKRLARLEKKQVTVVESIQYGNFLRVYCKLDKLLITEQWDDDES